MIIGTDDAEMPVRRVSILAAGYGAPLGATRYVRGSDVPTLIEEGRLRALDL
jgi:hypothetical protein